MKAQNTFKKPANKQTTTYKNALDALVGSFIVFSIAGLLALISHELALGFILFCILHILIMMRITQQKNN
jgi:hypothetical protein